MTIQELERIGDGTDPRSQEGVRALRRLYAEGGLMEVSRRSSQPPSPEETAERLSAEDAERFRAGSPLETPSGEIVYLFKK